MRCPGLLQMLKNNVAMTAQFEGKDVYMSPTVGDEMACASRFTIPVENTEKVFEVIIREVVTHKGLQELHPS